MDSRQLAMSVGKQECFPNLLRRESMETKCWWRRTGSTVDERLANRTWSESKSSVEIFFLQFSWCLRLFHISSLMFCLFSACTVFMLEYVTTSNYSVNSTLNCGLHCPLSHYRGPSDAADSQNTKISYHFIPLVHYFVLSRKVSLSWAFLVFLEVYKSSLTSAEVSHSPRLSAGRRWCRGTPILHINQMRYVMCQVICRVFCWAAMSSLSSTVRAQAQLLSYFHCIHTIR